MVYTAPRTKNSLRTTAIRVDSSLQEEQAATTVGVMVEIPLGVLMFLHISLFYPLEADVSQWTVSTIKSFPIGSLMRI
jgi:hypothetical protein